ELGEVGLLRRRARADELLREERQYHHDEDGECGALEEPAHSKSRARSQPPGAAMGTIKPSTRVSALRQALTRARGGMRGFGGQLVALGESGDVGQVAVALAQVEPVADREPVGYLEPHVARR